MFADPNETLIDEIALEGLDGITLETLWIRLRQLKDFHLQPNDDATKKYIFERIICSVCRSGEDLRFFSIAQPRPAVQLYNRYDYINTETGFCVSNDEGIPEDIYATIAPINENGVKGSCKDFFTRVDVTERVLIEMKSCYDSVFKHFGNRLVIVASQHQRERSLMITSIDPFIELNATQFCILERVARSRYMGEVTVGKETANFKESAKTQFYLRKVLLNKGFIRKQVHTMFNSKTHLIFRGLLLMHSRFYVERKSPIEVAASRLSDLLLQCENHECDYNELKERMNVKPKLYRHLYQTYMKHFSIIETDKPDTARRKKSPATGVKQRNRIRTVRLIKPFVGEDDNNEPEETPEEEDQEQVSMHHIGYSTHDQLVRRARIYNSDSFSINRTLLSQTFAIIERRNVDGANDGISLRELQNELKLPRLDIRMLIRMLERLDEVESIRVEVGRQKVTKYFLKNKERNESDPQVDSSVVDLFPDDAKVSVTFARRASLILQMVKENKIIDQINVLKKMLMENEKNLPYTIDQNSVKTIVKKLALRGMLRWIRTKLLCKDRITRINIICIPSIKADDPLIRERIEQAKFRYFGNVKEETNENTNPVGVVSNVDMISMIDQADDDRLQTSKETSEDPNCETVKQWRLIREKQIHESNGQDFILYQPAMGRKYGVEPKMKKVMTLYRFLFFLMSGGPELKDNSFHDWRKFITPLPEGREEDTCLIGDIVRRIPLSIFVKVVFITYIIPGLDELLRDPVRCNYPLHMISDDIRRLLLHRRKYIFSIIEVLTMLSYLNLVQLNSEPISAKEAVVVKLLRETTFMDDDQLRSYRMRSMDDVDQFITDLSFHASKMECNNCTLDTRLSVHNPRNWSYAPKLKRDIKMNKATKRLQRLNCHTVHTDSKETTSPSSEKNVFPLTISTQVTSTPAMSTRTKSKSSALTTLSLTTKRPELIITTSSSLSPSIQNRNNLPDSILASSSSCSTITTDTTITIHTATSNTTTNLIPIASGLQRKRKPDDSNESCKRARTRPPRAPVRSSNYDAKDKIALKMMKKQRCDWSKEEDSFLLMCRVTSAMLDPSCPTFICVNRQVVRDELHRYLPNVSFDKTSKACQRRVMYMLKNPATRAHILDWVAECKQDAQLVAIKRPTQPKSHSDVWNLAFLTLLHRLLRKFEAQRSGQKDCNNGNDYDQSMGSMWKLPRFKSIAEIEQQFSLFESELHVLPIKVPLYQQPQNVVDVYVNSVMNILVSTLMINAFDQQQSNINNSLDSNNNTNSIDHDHHSTSPSKDERTSSPPNEERTSVAQTLFKIYQRYPDTLIRSVVANAQKYGVIAKTKKDSSTSALKANGVIPYKISQHYQFVLRTRYCIDALSRPLALHCNFELPDQFGSTETALAVACFTLQKAHFSLSIPDNFIILDESNPLFCNAISGSKLRSTEEGKSSSRFALYMLRQQLTSQPGDKIQHVQDYLVLNKCSIRVRSVFDQHSDFTAFQQRLNHQSDFCTSECLNVETMAIGCRDALDRLILNEIEHSKELGLNEIQLNELVRRELAIESLDARMKCKEILNQLICHKLIHRVGITEFRYVHVNNAGPWQVFSYTSTKPSHVSSTSSHHPSETRSTIVDRNDNRQVRFLARFWKDPYGQVDNRVLYNYLSGILAHILAHPGIKEAQVIGHFAICLPPLQVLEILEMLIDADCLQVIELNVSTRMTLFNNHQSPTLLTRFYEGTPHAFLKLCQIRRLLNC